MAGPGGVEAVSCQDWLLGFEVTSLKLREDVAKLTRWLANTQPVWASYYALVAGHLIVLDKCPDVCPMGMGEVLLRMMRKCIISVCREDATEACSIMQFCLGLKVRIKGAIHTMNHLWAEHREEDIGVFFWLMQEMYSTKSTAGSCFGMYNTCGQLDPGQAHDEYGGSNTGKSSEKQLQEWFADDAALVGFFATIDHWFARLCEIGPNWTPLR
eukprot:6874052-Ditylum_brightwellii.AAC.1